MLLLVGRKRQRALGGGIRRMITDIPPAEAETNHYAASEDLDMAA